MMICDVIRNAESESVIYFLLAAYIEATQFEGKLPGHLTKLPITGLQDVETRFQQLMMERDRASEQLPDKSCVVIEEALHIFDAALCRLKLLERKKGPSLLDWQCLTVHHAVISEWQTAHEECLADAQKKAM